MNFKDLMENNLYTNVIICIFYSYKSIFLERGVFFERMIKLKAESILIPTDSTHFETMTKSSVRHKC